MQKEQNFVKRQAELSATKRALLEKRLKRLGGQLATVPTIGPRPVAETVPLSFAQQRLWFLQQLEPESAAYNEALATRLQGPLNQAAFTRTIREIIGRHEVLRCRFPLREGQVVQVVDQDVAQTFAIPYEDWRGLAAQQRETAVHRRARAEMERPFDLAEELPWRTFLFQLADEEYLSLSILHHIITDGWSIGVLYREIGHLYEAFSTGKASPLPPLPVQYGDYAYWQHQWIDGKEASEQLAYWQQQLHSPLPVLDLPVDRVRLLEPSYRGQRVPLQVPQSVSQQVQNVCRQTGATPFMVLLTGLLIVLQRYSGQDDLVVGTPIAGRMRPEVEALMGCFVNTLVLRAKLGGEPTVRALIQQVREVTLQAYDQQEVPFEKLVEVLQPERNLSRNPLFQVMFVLQNVPMSKLFFAGLSFTPIEVKNYTAKFDLLLDLQETEQGFSGYLEYNIDVFDASTIERIAQHFVQILHAMSFDLDAPVRELPLLNAEERQQILVAWNDTRVAYAADQCLPELFEAQVTRTPGELALVCNDERLTYAELNCRANQLAHHLRQLGIGPDVPVGICVERSIEMVVGLLGILKAGGAYVPLDTHYPQERLAFMLGDAQVPVLLTSQSLLATLPVAGQHVLCLDSDWTSIAQESQENPHSGVCPENLAYVIYTSGSTGKPKGAMNTHRGICNRLHWMQNTYHLNGDDRVLQKTPFSFDVSVWEFFWPLLTGACLVVAIPEGHRDSAYLVNVIAEQQITTVHFVPSMLRVLLEEQGLDRCGSLRRVICSGEALPFDLQSRFFARIEAQLYNLYGPTEAAVDVTFWACERNSNRHVVPIGRPIANIQMYLLDQLLQPVPVGVIGELYIGGVGLARGYHHHPALTAERFVPHPFSTEVGNRLYRTGDLGRYFPDGAIEFLGRNDYQVKIRGYRIELEEISSVLNEYPAVRESVVVASEGVSGDKRLVAYVVAVQEALTGSSEVRSYLQERLPEYMVPSSFVLLDALPLLPNGKLDRQALPELGEEEGRGDVAYVAPRTPLEEQLVAIWAEVLALKQVGVSDNFFTIGGHSLLITQVLARVRDAFEVTLPVRTLFKNPTIAGLAEAIEKVRSRSTELRKQTVVSISRDAFRQKRSSLTGNSSAQLKKG